MSGALHLTNEQWNSLRDLRPFASANEWKTIENLIAGVQDDKPVIRRSSANVFCPHQPWPKQQVFLDLSCKEAFYGGAAAGGKSEALLMAALQYVHIPGYSALILRKDTQRLQLSGGLIPRSHQWLSNSNATWNGTSRRWSFPTQGAPATISFGYLMDSKDKYRYGSSEYQYIAFDELTEFPENDYLFLFSRLRKTKDIPVPLRMRSASNPGNLGHLWVKNRFVGSSSDQTANLPQSNGVCWNGEIAFVPARIRDNPAVDEEEYSSNLSYLPSVLREQLMNGDWSVSEQGMIHQQWLRYYTFSGSRLQLRDKYDQVLATVDQEECYRFATVDPAGTSAERALEQKGRTPSWSVIAVWDTTPCEIGSFLILRHIWRRRVGFDQLCLALREVHQKWNTERILIEDEKLGRAAYDVMRQEIPLECVSTRGNDKLVRAGPFINKLEKGEIFLPKFDNHWLPDLEAEWLAWTGLNDEVCDQIDVAAYAAMECLDEKKGSLRMEKVFWR